MRATLILEASGSSGEKYRLETTLEVFSLGWLLRIFGP